MYQESNSAGCFHHSRRGSSLELFSSGSTTTANDSVILVSGDSATADQQISRVQSSPSNKEPRESSLSAFLYNRVRRNLDNPVANAKALGCGESLSACSTGTFSSNTSKPLFSSCGSSTGQCFVAMETKAAPPLVQKSMEVSQSKRSSESTTDSTNLSYNSSEELTGNSSDECDDLLSNKAYRLRKRKARETLSGTSSGPFRKRARCNCQVRKKTNHRRKQLNRKKIKSLRCAMFL